MCGFIDFDVKEARFWFCFKIAIFRKKYKNKGYGCFGSNCFRKMRNQAIFIQNILILKIICMKYIINVIYQSKQQNFLDIKSWLNSCSKIFVGL